MYMRGDVLHGDMGHQLATRSRRRQKSPHSSNDDFEITPLVDSLTGGEAMEIHSGS